ncbi:MAG: hypothetical protein NC922_02710 [Candidatus Omnitrophica bacterium]|nr:hypothetical protein [Candidatus Omnitrophota bacterium]
MEKKEKTEKNKMSEYHIDKLTMDFLNTVKNRTKPPIDIIRAIEFTVSGIISTRVSNERWQMA